MERITLKDIDAYIEQNREDFFEDLKGLLRIPSVRSKPANGAPYGAEVRRALDYAMERAEKFGLGAENIENAAGVFTVGDQQKHIGVLAHLDVVPAGNGWDAGPFEPTMRDGYLVARGVADDKGAAMTALYAAKFFAERGEKLKYGIRVILGCDEESGMEDIDKYLEHYEAPMFSFSPDSEFPVGCGEKGRAEWNVWTDELEGRVINAGGGVASNVVPDSAFAELRDVDAGLLREAAKGNSNITISDTEKGVRIDARGIGAHAAHSAGSLNAIYELARTIDDAGVLKGREAAFFRLLARSLSENSGKYFDIERDDGIFEPLSCIGGMLKFECGALVQNYDSRYPTNITQAEIEEKVRTKIGDMCVEFCEENPPFYIPPEYPAIAVMADAYREVTGISRGSYVMSGGTYARKLPNAVSFGPEKVRERTDPSWVGVVHMANEAIYADDLLDAMRIYILSLAKIQELEL